MFYINNKGNITVSEVHPGEGWYAVNDPKSSNYKLKENWKEHIPDVWEFNPFKVSVRLNYLIDKVVGDKLAKAYDKYIKELIQFKLLAQQEIDSIKSDADVEIVTNKIQKMADDISLEPVDYSLFK